MDDVVGVFPATLSISTTGYSGPVCPPMENSIVHLWRGKVGCYLPRQDPGSGCRCLEDKEEDQCLNSCQDRCNQLGRAGGGDCGAGSGNQADRGDTLSGRWTPGTSLKGNFKQRWWRRRRTLCWKPSFHLIVFQFTSRASVAVAFTFTASLISVEASWTGRGDAAARDAVVTSWTNVPVCSLGRSSGLWSLQAVET